MSISDVSGMAVALSAIVATVTLIVATVTRIAENRAKEISKWQRAVVHQIFQKSDARLSFEDIIHKYRNESVAFQDYKLRSDDLSPQTLRLILMDMVQSHLIGQIGSDEYELPTKKSFEEMFSNFGEGFPQSFVDAMVKSAPDHTKTEMMVLQEAFDLVRQSPNRYTVSDAAVMISKSLEIPFDTAKGHIVGLIAKKTLRVDEKDRLFLSPDSPIDDVNRQVGKKRIASA